MRIFVALLIVLALSSVSHASSGKLSCWLRAIQSHFQLSVDPDLLKRNYTPTHLKFELTGLSDYGIEKQKKESLLQQEKRIGLHHIETPSEREFYKVYVNNGIFYDARGYPLDSSETKAGFTYVMDGEGNIYVGNLHHPGYLAFGKVAAAGHVHFSKGRLRKANRDSGQYAPKRKHLLQFKERIEELGASSRGTFFDFEGMWGD